MTGPVCGALVSAYADPEAHLAGALALAYAIDTEEFETRPNDFLPPDAKAKLKDFRGLFLRELMADANHRKKLRPLDDTVARAGG